MPALRPARPRLRAVSAGPFVGMRDTPSPGVPTLSLALLSRNMVVDPDTRTSLMTRPGYGSATGLGTTIGTQCRAVVQFDRRDGTRYTLYFYNQKMYKLVGTILTEVVLGGGVAIAAPDPNGAPDQFPIFWTIFNDQLVVSDGVTKPWTWDGTTFTSLTNAPVAWGRPTAYYAKLFFIKASERSTIVWSEEADATTGYEAGGYNNAWTLGQTSSSPLGAILGTNEGLYYWRTDGGFDVIRGEVSSDFVTSGTVSGISQDMGTASPMAVALHDDTIWFVDQNGHPQRYAIGGGLQRPEVWQDGATTFRGDALSGGVDLSRLGSAVASLHPFMPIVLFLIPAIEPEAATPPLANPYYMLPVFGTETGQLISFWSNLVGTNYFDAQSIGVVYVQGAWRLSHGAWVPWIHQNPREEAGGQIPYYTDNYASLTSSGVAVISLVETPDMGTDDPSTKRWQQVSAYLNGDSTTVGMQYRTSLAPTLTTRSDQNASGRLTWGTSGYGRTARFRITRGNGLEPLFGYDSAPLELGRIEARYVQAADVPYDR